MKKKVKLFSTIASLCLAVALMAFGVWAATNVNFSITNKVSFTATANVKATVSAVANVGANTAYAGEDKKAATIENIVLTGSETGDATTPLEKTIAFGDNVAIKETDATQPMYYYYTITIANNATATDSYPTLVVNMTTVALSDDYATNYYTINTVVGDVYNAESPEAVTAKEYEVAVGKTFVYTVVFKANPAKTLTNIDLATAFTLTAK